MSSLRSAVYVVPPLPIGGGRLGPGEFWSPISCTLVYSEHEAVLVDTPVIIKQTGALIEWIERIASRKLRYIYITHGHGDHSFGIPLLVQRFPESDPLATEATLEHMKEQVSEKTFHEIWDSFFPGQIHRPFVLAKPIPAEWNIQFKLENRWISRAIECGRSDTYDSTILWVPDLRLTMCGDVVYGQAHQMLMEANTRAKRNEWIRATELVEKLGLW